VEASGNRGTNGAETERFDPYLILSALERHRVSYVVIGAFARVVQGTGEVTHGFDITLSLRRENIARANRALAELDARTADGQPAILVGEPAKTVTALRTRAGKVTVVPLPEGTRGYDDLRRHATHEAIGGGLRAQIASPGDLARMLGAPGIRPSSCAFGG
jgi:hypothetical protein